MKDPYEVLGVSRGASVEEIKNAYHELVKKYHPDKYRDNPLADLAQEKLTEINEAYDYLMRQANGADPGAGKYGRRQSAYDTNSYGGSYGGGSYGGAYGSGFSSDFEAYQAARQAINANQTARADQILSEVKTRDAEWYYLMGMVNVQKGYIDNGLTNIRTAIQMAPTNIEYRTTYNRLTSAGNRYYNASNSSGFNSDTCAQCIESYCCSSLISPCW